MNAAITHLESFYRNFGDPDRIHVTASKGDTTSHFNISSAGTESDSDNNIAGYVVPNEDQQQEAAEALADLRRIGAPF